MLMKSNRGICSIILASAVFFSVCSCSYSRTEQSYCFGTVCTVTVFQRTDSSVFEKLWKEMGNLEKKISALRDDSEISCVNRRAGSGMWTEVSRETYSIVSLMLEVCNKTNGVLNPAIGSVTSLWGIATDNARVPSGEEIESALECTDYRLITIKQEGEKFFIRLGCSGMRLDLGASGKGMAGDIAASVLRENGIKSALINFGGNIAVVGKRRGLLFSRPFRIGIQEPYGERGSYSHSILVSDASVVTSGSYERFLESDGTVYSHIMDPFSGYPVLSDSSAVTVTGPRGDICDCLSTACFIMGAGKSEELMKDYPDYSAVFLFSDNERTETVVVGNKVDLQ